MSSLDLLAYPLQYTNRLIVAVMDARRGEVFHALLPAGPRRAPARQRLRRVDAPTDLPPTSRPGNEEAILVGDGALLHADQFYDLTMVELASAGPRVPEHARRSRAGPRPPLPRGLPAAVGGRAALPAQARRGGQLGADVPVSPTTSGGGVESSTAAQSRDRGDADRAAPELPIEIVRCGGATCGPCLRIEAQVYPRPVDAVAVPVGAGPALERRAYFVARRRDGSSATPG